MQPKFTLKKRGVSFFLTPLFSFLLILLSGTAFAQQYVNGNLSTGATHAGTGTVAPAGTTWSELQGSNTTYGSAAVAGTFTLADNFVVPAGSSWNLTKVTFFAYSTGYAGATSPFVDTRVQIFNTDPSVGTPTPIYGDLTTNRFSASSLANIFRTSNTAADQSRRVWKIEATVNVTLAPGTYWIEWAHGNGGLSNFTPPSTVAGVPSPAGANSKQHDLTAGTWTNLTDVGGPQDQYFLIDYTTGACAGTPAPGNTVSSLASACAGVNFTLSLQNPTPGSGVTYQWQSSPDGTTWTNITGATSSTYTTTLTAQTRYRCNVTCGGNTGTSAPVTVNLTPPSGCYCAAGATSTAFEKISNVTFNTINNNSTSTAGYENFLTVSTQVIKGQVLPISVSLASGFSTDQVFVWIDFNQNGSFSDAGELVYTSAQGVGPHVGNVTIPATALTGSTRMRVRMHDASLGANSTPCGNSTYGQVEDYTVDVQPCVPIAITSSPVNRTVTCGGNTTFVIATTGSAPAYSWQWRANSTSVWQAVSNGGVYSGATTATLTLTNVDASYNGYQYRALVSGACAATDFTTVATLTVTPIQPVVTPASASVCLGAIQQLSLTNTLSNTDLLTEGFTSASPLPTGWAAQNLSSPAGPSGWFQGNTTVFPAQSGAANSYIAANWQNTTTTGSGTISNWLFTPQLPIKNGDKFAFWTRSTASGYPDRMEVRMSSNGASVNAGATATSVGDFTTLLLTINPDLTASGYPGAWTQYTVTVSGLASPVSGRFAFRYYVTDGGGNAANSDYIGVDNVVFTSVGATAQGSWNGPAGTIFTDAAATNAYTLGTPATTVYVKPSAPGVNNYTVSFTTLTPCTSATATIPVTVSAPITAATVTPATRAVCLGGSTTFGSSVTGGTNTTYQWQRSTDAGLTWSNISGATTATLTVSNVTLNMTGYRYRFVASSGACASLTSTNFGTLTVNALPVVTIASPTVNIIPGVPTTITGSSTPAAAATNSWSWTLNGAALNGNTNTRVASVDSLGTYQATVTDVNGCVNSSNQLVIGAQASDKLWIYPNPTPGAFQVRLYYGGNTAEKRVVSVYNAKGQLITSRTFDLNYRSAPYLSMNFDLSGMARGTYVVKVAHEYSGNVISGLVLVH